MLKIKLLIFTFFVCFCLLAQEPLVQIEAFGKNQGNLKMYTYIPKNLNSSKKIPLVVVVHGCTQSAKMIASETGWNKLADSLNFIVVYPEQKQINNAAKCYNYFIGYKAKKDKGEVASIKQMIDFSVKNYYVDNENIFITGFSSGGAISNAMLNAYPKLFNAGALFAAPSNLFNLNKKGPNDQPKIAIIQGLKDNIVNKENANRILVQWLKKDQLNHTNFILKEDYQSNPLLSAKYFYDTEKKLKIVSISAKNVKHKLMISPAKGVERGGTMDFHTVNINFHSTYWVALFFGLTSQK